MKKLLIGLVFFSFGCSANQGDIVSVELMSYNWDLKYPTESFKGKFFIQPKLYSVLNLKGENQTYVCEFIPNRDEVYFNSKIDAKIMADLVSSLPSIERSEIPIDSYSQNGCVESFPTIRLKIIYSNKKQRFYQYDSQDKTKVNLVIEKMYIALNLNKVEEKFETMEDTIYFNKKKKAFINFSMNTDTLKSPLPPLPVYKKVRFRK